MTAVRLIIDPPADGAWNMAVDEVLLRSAATAGVATLRFYQWAQPTLSLGYFQAASDREQHAASRECPLVRRASGGGAIVHDRELTYSLALPVKDRLAAAAVDVYDLMHETLTGTLASFGIGARRFGPDSSRPKDKNISEPFLCFQRRSPGDVLCEEFKIAGSAQRRQRGALVQHGSVLLAQSAQAPQLPGILQLAGVSLHRAELSSRWGHRVTTAAGFDLSLGGLTDSELLEAETVQAQRFANVAWTFRRDSQTPLS